MNSKRPTKSKPAAPARRRRLDEPRRIEELRALGESALNLVRENEGRRVPEATLQLAAAQIYEALAGFDLRLLQKTLKTNPANYMRLVTVLARLGDSALKYEAYRANVAERKANLEKEMALARSSGFTPETLARMEAELKLL